MNNLKLKFSIALFIATGSASGVTIDFDTDNKAARKQREEAFAEAAKKGYMVAASHVSFPGIGQLRKPRGEKNYVWIPLNYSGLK